MLPDDQLFQDVKMLVLTARQNATIFSDFEIVYAARKLFSWTHFRIFIHLEDELKRRFYMEMYRIEGWKTRCPIRLIWPISQ